tara:strand:+ start:414 stop:650 length:237 start_codon:yes stop_codon:yes gene_type:complete
MTKGLERIIEELKGENKEIIIERLYSENKIAKQSHKLRLASDLNNLIFYLNNPEIKPGGVKKEDLSIFKELLSSIERV